MFRHVVVFNWKPGTSPEAVAAIGEALKACADAVPVSCTYTCGSDVNLADADGRGDRYDFVIVADFEDQAAWKVYDEDAEHNRIRAELIRPIVDNRRVVQFEFAD
jgi:predicted NAD/FAD-binding protein